jgi:hypothetical protein
MMHKVSLATFFKGRPQSFRLFRLVRTYIHSLGECKMKVSRTQISFSNRRQFAWVWLPQVWTNSRPEGSITLSFRSNHLVRDKSIVEVVETYPGRWMHHVVIDGTSGFSSQVKAWIRRSYAEAGLTRSRP